VKNKLFTTGMVLFFLTTTLVFAGPKEKIAVAGNDKMTTSAVSGQAGRAPYYLFFDGKGKLVEAVENPYKDKDGAGKLVADFLAGKGVTVVVAEGFGGPIVDVLKGKGIRPVAFKGAIAEAAKKVVESK
jgi:predicted Fe-Mo cluster-binding NifX family protein